MLLSKSSYKREQYEQIKHSQQYTRRTCSATMSNLIEP